MQPTEATELKRLSDALDSINTTTNGMAETTLKVRAKYDDLLQKIKDAVAAGDNTGAITVLADKALAQGQVLTDMAAALNAVAAPEQPADGGTGEQPNPNPPVIEQP